MAAGLVPLNSTMIAVALPDIADQFDIAAGSAGVLVTIYLVVMLVGQPTLGRLIDAIGPRRALRWALFGFIGASVAATCASTFSLLVIGRAIQAVFGAVLMPSSQALLRSMSDPSQRGRSFGLLGSFIGAGAAAGPVLGGIVTAVGGWRGLFLVNVPFAATALWSVASVRSSPGAGGRAPGGPNLARVLTQRAFGAAFVAQAMTTLGQYSLLLVVPIVLDSRGWTSAQVGVALTALTAGMVLMGPAGGRVGDRRGRRLPVILGIGAAACATIVAALVLEESPVGLVAAITIFGFGLGFAIPSVQTAALEAVPEELAGSAAGILSTSRYTGSIPASLLFAFLVSDDGEGSRALLAVASLAMVMAVLAAVMLPSPAQDMHPDPSGSRERPR
jgi:MFS family permease